MHREEGARLDDASQNSQVSSTDQDTHARILRAALTEFTQRGYKGASTRGIAERAGVNEVTLFRHFGSKLDLLRVAVKQALMQMKIPQDLAPYLQGTLEEGLSQFVSDYLLQVTAQSDILMLGFSEAFSQPEISDLLREFMWKMRGMIVRYFEAMHEKGAIKEGDYPILAHIIMTSLHGAASMRKRTPIEMAQLSDERLTRCLVKTIVDAYANHALDSPNHDMN